MSPSQRTGSGGLGADDRVRIASALQSARTQAGLTGPQAAQHAGFGQSKLSKIERAALLPSPADVAALCRTYGIPAAQQEALVQLAVDLREQQSSKIILSRSVGQFQVRIRQLESSASTIRSYQPTIVLGLLQTDAYARCVFGQPDSHELDPGEIDEAVHERTDRQTILDDHSKDLQFVMTEGALRWQAGSPALMAAQLDAIAQATERPNLRLGIIPWTTPVTFFPRHGFHIYDTDAVTVATETAFATMTGRADVETYAEMFAALTAVADYDDAAREHLQRIASEYRLLASL